MTANLSRKVILQNMVRLADGDQLDSHERVGV